MTGEHSDDPIHSDPLAQLEQAFIVEFLQGRGHTLSSLHDLSGEAANRLLREASLYASGRLTEVESRAHFVTDIHDGTRPVPVGTRGRGRSR